MKIHFPKIKRQVVCYRKYKGFHNETFLDSLRHDLNVQFLNEKRLDAFSTICTEIFDKHAPKKKRYIQYNHKLFINNEIYNAPVTRIHISKTSNNVNISEILPHGIFAAGGAFVPTQEKKKYF